MMAFILSGLLIYGLYYASRGTRIVVRIIFLAFSVCALTAAWRFHFFEGFYWVSNTLFGAVWNLVKYILTIIFLGVPQ